MQITLEHLLESRDNRRRYQKELLDKYNNLTLICLTVIMPGSVKRNRFSLTVAKAAIKELNNKFSHHIIFSQEKDLPTGYEYYIITDTRHNEAKKICCDIEETHQLGRLFDIDVIDTNGEPLSRESIGYKKRRCLLCENEARFCMRNHTHSQEEIQNYITELIDSYTE